MNNLRIVARSPIFILLAFAAVMWTLVLNGCATTLSVGPSPEAQIKTGADVVRAAADTTTALLQARKITPAQAKGYSTMLRAAGDALDDANADLVQCRATTGPAPAGAADQCWPKVSELVTLALDNIGGIQKALAGK